MTDTIDPILNDRVSRRAVLAAASVVPATALVAAHAQSSGNAPLSSGRTHNKAALVTGASRGIGAAIAQRLARDGYQVVINYRGSKDQAVALVREIQRAGGQALEAQADVGDSQAVRQLFDTCEQSFGGIDVVVANAGVAHTVPFAEMTDEDFEHIMNVNIRGSFYTLREAARRVREGGHIIALSSSLTVLRSPGSGPYAASKAALEVFVNVLAKELAGRQISVNAVAPGPVNTSLFTTGKTPEQIAAVAARTPHKRLGEPADIAAVVAALCGPDCAWINGQVIFANGGLV
ncbi:MAG: SDR family oxidoreductase [Gammaproteobacteria bacterium]|nr:3-oxoacyl-ACP reductase [Gammaproteobacteria bacterium]